jgi:hypothetical protein
MSEPLGVEERARLRVMVNAIMPSSTLSESIIALLDEVDRLTEQRDVASKEVHRLNAEVDRLRTGVEEQAGEYGCSCLLDYRPCVGCRLRALLGDNGEVGT